MSFGINKVMVGGNLTADPETRYTPKGVCITKFTIAANRSYKDGDGEKKEECEFLTVTAFGRQAEVIAEYMKKGKPLLVEGRIKTDTWEDDKDVKHWRTGIILEGFHFLGGGKDDDNEGDNERPRKSSTSGKHKTRREDPPGEKSAKGKAKPARKGHDYSEDDPDWNS